MLKPKQVIQSFINFQNNLLGANIDLLCALEVLYQECGEIVLNSFKIKNIPIAEVINGGEKEILKKLEIFLLELQLFLQKHKIEGYTQIINTTLFILKKELGKE